MLPKRIRAPILLATLSISVSAAALFYADTNLAIAAALLLLTEFYVRVSLQDIIYYNPSIQQPFTIPLKSASEVEPFLAKRDDAARRAISPIVTPCSNPGYNVFTTAKPPVTKSQVISYKS